MKEKITWGTCWFNESVEKLIEFYLISLKNLCKLGFNVIPIVFDAKLNRDNFQIKLLKSKINNIIILQNTTNIYPNKNYGIAAISNESIKYNTKFTAIVDCDWNINQNMGFIKKTLLYMIYNKLDLIIPNIGSASGRSNLLIGKVAINLFYPEYKDKIVTPFPGSLIIKTVYLNEIVNDDNYHFDWGGEWDIISISIKKKLKIDSPLVEVVSTRHRPNNSKILDSFQIWRAILSNDDINARIKNVKKYDINIQPYDQMSELIINNNTTAKDFIDLVLKYSKNETQKQLLYMILYPLSLFTDNLNLVQDIENDITIPYEKNELIKVSDLALYCAKVIFENNDINYICKNCKNITSIYLSNWNIKNQRKAMKDYRVI